MLAVAAMYELVAVALPAVDIMVVAAVVLPEFATPLDFADAVPEPDDFADAVPEPDALVLDAVPVAVPVLAPVTMVLVSMAEELPWAVTRVAMSARRTAVIFMLMVGLEKEL